MTDLKIEKIRLYCGFHENKYYSDSPSSNKCLMRHTDKSGYPLFFPNYGECRDINDCPFYNVIIKLMENK